MSLYLMPHRGASLSTWSFGDGTPQFDLSGEYFVFYSHGLDAPTWTFWFEIQVKEQAVLPWRSARPAPKTEPCFFCKAILFLAQVASMCSRRSPWQISARLCGRLAPAGTAAARQIRIF